MLRKPKDLPPNEQRVVLSNLSWQKFEQILGELGADRRVRLSYWRGKLEMMTPVAEHQRCQRLIESLILVVVDELKQSVTPIAPALIRNADLGCATEPDAGYYFESLTLPPVIELPQDPTPELIVEVALTKSNLDKMPIYASLGIPEVWRYLTSAGEDILQGKLQIYRLEGDSTIGQRYLPQNRSGIFEFLSGDRILQFLEQSDTISLAAALKILRAWMQEN
jgi:Uma2 family endonuclease